jgi:uncharacterized protein YjiS (DUF1127 family)
VNLSDEVRCLPDTHQTVPLDLRLWLARAHALLRYVGGLWTARIQRAREMEELYQFTDRELSDLGLSKSDLPAIEKGVYRRD